MELRQLRYFVAVAEELHFGKAAKKLAISQPPLSFNIKRLEESLGFDLFIRTTRAVQLTEAGNVFYGEAVRLLSLATQAKELGKKAAKGEHRNLRIGFVSTALLSPVANRLNAFSRANSNLTMTFHELNSYEQVNALHHKHIDYGIFHPRALIDGLDSMVLLKEPFVCVLPEKHSLSHSESIDLKHLEESPFILFPRHFSPEYYDRIISICNASGFSPEIHYEVRSYSTVMSLVASGFGVALVPDSIKKIQLKGVSVRPIKKQSKIKSELLGVWRKDETNDNAIRLLIEGLRAN